MSASILPKIDLMIAELQAIRAEVVREQSGAAPAPIYMSIEEYAAHASVSRQTVTRWLASGLPCVRRGRVVRIKVAEADAWTPADAIARSAARAAHGGGR